MNNNPTSILASFSTIKSMVDAKQYQSPYQILAFRCLLWVTLEKRVSFR